MPQAATAPLAGRLAIPDVQKAVLFGLAGGCGGLAGAFVTEPLQATAQLRLSPDELMLMVAIWFAVIGAGIAAGLVLGLGRYLRGRVAIDRWVGTTAGVGAFAGFLSGYIAQYLFTQGTTPGARPSEALRVVCWAMAGGMLGAALGRRLPNLGMIRGAIGGGAGGLLGGIIFVILSYGTGDEMIGRLAGCGAIGFLVGLMIVLTEAALREAWLEVVFAPGERRVVSLGAQPVSVGSGPDCTVFVNGAPERAFVFRLQGGAVWAEDVVAGRKEAIAPGETRRVGRVDLVVHTQGNVTSLTQRPMPASSVAPSTPASPVVPRDKSFTLHLPRHAALSLAPGCRLSGADIPGLEPGPGSRGGAVAEVAFHPSLPGVVGLMNLSRQPWQVRMTDGTKRQIDPGRAVTLAAGLRLDFGRIRGEVG